MEEEARDILRQAVGQTSAPNNLGQAIHSRFAAVGGFDLPQPTREEMRRICNIVTDSEGYILS